jgi:hypothetical protein
MTTTGPNIFVNDAFEQLLLANWAEVVNRSAFVRRVIEDAQIAHLTVLRNQEAPPRRVLVTVTKFKLRCNSVFEIWAEFSAPLENGVAVGTHVYTLGLNGGLLLEETSGVLFASES